MVVMFVQINLLLGDYDSSLSLILFDAISDEFYWIVKSPPYIMIVFDNHNFYNYFVCICVCGYL